MLPLIISAVGAGGLGCLAFKTVYPRSKLPYPPSPPSEPIIGHARLLAAAAGNEHYAFYELGKEYGGIIFMSALGHNLAIVNDSGIAEELLTKRASIYSSRPMTPAAETMGFSQSLILMPPGDDFKTHRRLFQRYFRQDKVHEHHPIQARESLNFIRNLLKNPESFMDHAVHYATAIIIDIGFGHVIEGDDDPYIKIADDICKYVVPNLVLADPLAAITGPLYPILQYLPSWFPLAYYASRARALRPYVRKIYDHPFTEVKKQLADGTAKPSFLATQLSELDSGTAIQGLTLEGVKGAAAMTYVAGAETTSNTMLSIIAALLMYPQCQQKVHEELDKVVGVDRLPTFQDRDSLPYLERFLQEVSRWQPIGSLLTHTSTEDDVYNGMFIPKGTVVVANARAMTLDETIYKDPFEFDPDRYLRGEPYPVSTWGFGRRICPGRYLAIDSVWITIVYFAATMIVKPALDENGKEISPDVKFVHGGTTNHPKPFQCHIEPRNGLAAQVSSISA